MNQITRVGGTVVMFLRQRKNRPSKLGDRTTTLPGDVRVEHWILTLWIRSELAGAAAVDASRCV